MNKKIVVVLVLVVVVLGGYFLLKSPQAQAPSPEVSQTETSVVPPTPLANELSAVDKNTVTYTDAGYSPSTLTIKAGETVIFKNESAQNMWTASGMHPSHILYSGTSLSAHCPDPMNTSFDACKGTPPGESWSFKFEKVGSWKYHDHLNPGFFGTIIVE